MSSIQDMIKCVSREIRLRKSAYPKWIEDGRMNPEISRWEIVTMEAVLKTLNEIADKNQGKLDL